jgi:hypothetical protein
MKTTNALTGLGAFIGITQILREAGVAPQWMGLAGGVATGIFGILAKGI